MNCLLENFVKTFEASLEFTFVHLNIYLKTVPNEH